MPEMNRLESILPIVIGVVIGCLIFEAIKQWWPIFLGIAASVIIVGLAWYFVGIREAIITIVLIVIMVIMTLVEERAPIKEAPIEEEPEAEACHNRIMTKLREHKTSFVKNKVPEYLIAGALIAFIVTSFALGLPGESVVGFCSGTVIVFCFKIASRLQSEEKKK